MSSSPHPKTVPNQPVVLTASAMSLYYGSISSVTSHIVIWDYIKNMDTEGTNSCNFWRLVPLVLSAVGLFWSTNLTLSLMKANHKHGICIPDGIT